MIDHDGSHALHACNRTPSISPPSHEGRPAGPIQPGQVSVSLDAHAVLLPQFAGLHDFTECLLQLRKRHSNPRSCKSRPAATPRNSSRRFARPELRSRECDHRRPGRSHDDEYPGPGVQNSPAGVGQYPAELLTARRGPSRAGHECSTARVVRKRCRTSLSASPAVPQSSRGDLVLLAVVSWVSGGCCCA